jgi:GNAT superfamily N-acetyltransferase
MSDVIATEEALTDATADEVLQFMRTANPFSQHTWGWDMGRFVDWRWGSNAIRAIGNPNWFGDTCRIFRSGNEIEAVSISEYGEDAEAIITSGENREVVGYVLRLLIERHRERGDAIGVEFSDSAEWLRQVCRDAGMSEKPQSGCEWEYDLGSVDTESLLPEGFTVETLQDAPEGILAGIGECIQLAFDSPRDQEPALRSIETNPMFRPELSVFALSPEGIVAAYCRGTVDPISGVCGIDPICTHPDYQKLGLGKAVVRTTFAAQRKLGGRFAYIGSAPPPAPGTFLYQSLGPSGMSMACEWVG